MPTVTVDENVLRANVSRVRKQCGVDVIAVMKADAYGLGATQVAAAIADLVDGFYVFSVEEAIAADLPAFGKEIIALQGDWHDAGDYISRGIRPVVWDVDRAAALRAARPVLAIDTGQQRFAAPAAHIDAILRAGEITEVMTHATKVEHISRFAELTAGRILRRHAAATALLGDAHALFDAVRPGLAIYDGAVTVTAPLVEVRESLGPAGYSGFRSKHFGLIFGGYSNGLHSGPAIVNGRRSRVLECGMQTSFIELAPDDRVGDIVTLLGGEISARTIAELWSRSPQHGLVNLCRAGRRVYVR